MTLADTSVWIEFFRKGSPALSEMLELQTVYTHPFVIGELACGSIPSRSTTLRDLAALPSVQTATHDEAIAFLDIHSLWSRGLGWIDIHLLASAKLSGVGLWTLDRRLAEASVSLGVPPPTP